MVETVLRTKLSLQVITFASIPVRFYPLGFTWSSEWFQDFLKRSFCHL